MPQTAMTPLTEIQVLSEIGLKKPVVMENPVMSQAVHHKSSPLSRMTSSRGVMGSIDIWYLD